MSRPQNNLNLTLTLKIAYFLPKKAKKNTLKLDKNQKLELKKIQKEAIRALKSQRWPKN